MIKHCLGNSNYRDTSLEERVFLYNFSLQKKRKHLRVQVERADIIHSQREIKEIFDPENSPFHYLGA